MNKRKRLKVSGAPTRGRLCSVKKISSSWFIDIYALLVARSNSVDRNTQVFATSKGLSVSALQMEDWSLLRPIPRSMQ